MRALTGLANIAKLALFVGLAGALLAFTIVQMAPQTYTLTHANESVAEEIDLSRLDDFKIRSFVYASDGSTIASLVGAENRQPIALPFVPEPVVQSILAVEDADFYHHPGVNIRGMFRALVENVSAGGIEQGGSTITQQLVKNTLLTADQDFDRKSREIALALQLEKQLSKDEILEKYLNAVYFGSGAYGVQAAAETYWGKPVSELGWAEGAMLAALISQPEANDPTLHPEAAKQARARAFERLIAEGELTREEVQFLEQVDVPRYRCGREDSPALLCNGQEPPPPEDYFSEEVRQQLLTDPRFGIGSTPEERYYAVYGGGLKVYTTLDPQAQDAALAARDEIAPKSRDGLTASIVGIENGTGAVRVMVGGPGFENFEYNIATREPGRQTGSSFKTFVLLTALEQGNVPNDYVDGGGSFPNPGGTPDPYNIQGRGGTLTSVTTASSNGAFVRLGEIVEQENVIDLARRLGITTPLSPELTLPLGTFEVPPMQMASAYTAIPNGGIREPWYLIDRIENAQGETIYQHTPEGTRAFSAQTACLAAEILEENVQSGTGTRARLNRQPAAGKTGTTDKGSDVWFVGFTPYLTTAVWMGFSDSNAPLPSVDGIANFGGFYPARIWQQFNAAYHDEREVQGFAECDRTRGGQRVSGPRDTANRLPPSNEGGEYYEQAPTETPNPTRPPTTTNGGGGGPTTTAAPPPTAPPPTDPPPTDPPPTDPPPGAP